MDHIVNDAMNEYHSTAGRPSLDHFPGGNRYA